MMRRGTVPSLSEVQQCFAELTGVLAFSVGEEGRRVSFLPIMHAGMAQAGAGPAQKDGEGGEPLAPGSQISMLRCIATVRTI